MSLNNILSYEEIIQLILKIPNIHTKIDTSILAIREELVGIQALNAHARHNSASRGLMQVGQFAQLGVLIKPEPPIIQEGISFQLADNTWKCIVEEDCVVKAIIASKDYYDIKNTETIILLVETIDGTLDIIDVPLFYFVNEFGFRYERNIDILSTITVGTKLLKGVILAETPGVVNGTYAYGINADMKLVTSPNNGQDGIEISTELAERMAYRTYHKFECNYNNDKILLNTYGDDKNYIPLPRVGDSLRQDGLVMAFRTLSPDNIPPNIYDISLIDSVYDECFYLKDATVPITINNETMMNNKVVSVKVYRSPSKKDLNIHAKEAIDASIEDLKQIHRRIVNTYNKHEDKRKLTPRASKAIVESLALVSPDVKSELRYRNDVFTTRVEVIIEATHKLKIGNKLTCQSGGKGIVVNIIPRAELGADICMDPTSLPGRTNPGRVYIMYFGGSSRNAKEIILHTFHTEGLERAFEQLVDFLSYYDTEQYLVYKYFYENRNIQPGFLNFLRYVMDEIEKSELYIYYKINSKKKSAYIVRELEKSKWGIRKRNIISGDKMTKKPITVAPLYVILLAKAHDNYLSCSSPYLNHYFIPVKPPSSMKHRKPFSNTSTKLSGETELRVNSTNTLHPEYVAEMISRNTNMESHSKICETLLTHKTPTNIDHIVTRNPDGSLPDGNPLAIAKAVLRTMGIGIMTVPELEDDEDKAILQKIEEGEDELANL